MLKVYLVAERLKRDIKTNLVKTSNKKMGIDGKSILNILQETEG